MNLLAVVTPLSIYHGFSNHKMLLGVKFTLGEFTPVNMKICGRLNVSKHREIKYSDKYVTLGISLKFGNLDKMRSTSSDPKEYFGRSVKRLITSLGIKSNVRSKKYKKESHFITNVRMKNILKIIKEFEKLPYKGYLQKRPKHEPTDS